MEATRLLLASVPASLVTFALFHLMNALIHVEWLPPPPSDGPFGVDIVRIMLPPPRPAPPPVGRKLIPPAPPPSAPSPPIAGPGRGTGIAFHVPEAGMGKAIEEHGARGSAGLASEGEALALVRVEAQYPSRALQQRREGRVLIEFTIGASGAVEAPRVIAAEPPGVFEATALKAISQWRYSPKVVNGRAVPQPGVRTTIVFRLDQAGS